VLEVPKPVPPVDVVPDPAVALPLPLANAALLLPPCAALPVWPCVFELSLLGLHDPIARINAALAMRMDVFAVNMARFSPRNCQNLALLAPGFMSLKGGNTDGKLNPSVDC
jgi:hypothetical protein